MKDFIKFHERKSLCKIYENLLFILFTLILHVPFFREIKNLTIKMSTHLPSTYHPPTIHLLSTYHPPTIHLPSPSTTFAITFNHIIKHPSTTHEPPLEFTIHLLPVEIISTKTFFCFWSSFLFCYF